MSDKPKAEVTELEAMDNRVFATIKFTHPITGEEVNGVFSLFLWNRSPVAVTADLHRRLMNPIVGVGGKRRKPARSRNKTQTR